MLCLLHLRRNMLLTERLPVTLGFNGKEYPIQTDFRSVLRYESRMSRETEAIEIIRAVDEMYCRNDEILTVQNFPQAVEQLNWFIACGEQDRKKLSNASLGLNRNKPFDFAVDGALIYSSFIQSYRMDLYDMEYLHWWKFNALLADVSKDCRFSKVMEYRTIDLKNKSLSREQKKLYSVLQNYYKISEKRSQAENDFVKALLEGRDPMKK